MARIEVAKKVKNINCEEVENVIWNFLETRFIAKEIFISQIPNKQYPQLDSLAGSVDSISVSVVVHNVSS